MADQRATSAVEQFTLRKKLAFSAVAVFGFFLVLEVVCRIGAFVVYERSPYFLVYGLRSLSSEVPPLEHSVIKSGYFTFTPSTVLHQYGLFREPTPIQINNHGFRGADFAAEKPRGTIRIIAIGESSTFGYFDRDEYTYPALLQGELRAEPALAGKNVEVINAGLPHAKSANFKPMMRQEIVDYDPDIVTLYAAYNDAAFVADANFLQTTARWIHAHFVTYVALKHLVDKLGGPELYSRWTTYEPGATAEYVRHQVDLHVEEFAQNVTAIIEEARSRGIDVILIRQPIRMVPHEDYERDSLRLREYGARVALAESLLAADGRIAPEHSTTLIHSALIDVVDSLARHYGLPLVDNISIVDQHPEYFASYVHLTEDANAALAKAMVPAVLATLARRGAIRRDSVAEP